jgi:uncharacterized membrane protein
MVLLLFAGFSLTLLVEVIVLKGDIGRMNTVFKFYLQAWTFLGLGAAWCFCQLIVRNRRNAFGFQARKVWSTIFFLLIISVSLFTITASIDKVKDRISNKTPITLDGMEFMNYSEYLESDSVMDLSHDYEAIHWMQENIMGTPVIVEANVPEYRWGNRFTMYTGLPGVLGWNWHQRQQRSINPPNWVTDRADDINEFYSSDDLETAKEFLKKYHVKYIVVGQLEKIVYPMEGINKFNDQLEGFLSVVYSADDTIIYEVN